jgi:chemotaxis protein MotB
VRSFPLRTERARRAAAAALALWACGATGCAQLALERDRLREENEQLQRSTTSLSAERDQLLEEIEDLRLANQKLEKQVADLGRARGDLEKSLKNREAELKERTSEVEELRETYDGLVTELQSEVQAGRVEVERLREGLRVNLADEIVFPPGSARLDAAGRKVLQDVAGRLRDAPYSVEVQGHTDDQKTRGGAFPTNWELAAARAAAVARVLEEEHVDPTRLSVVSFGEYQPLVPNDTPENRARNRRIELRLLPLETAEARAAPADADAAAPDPSAAPR